MNGIENIKKRIKESADERARQILSSAESDANKISEEYRKKSEKIVAEETERANAAAKALYERLSGSAELESKKAFLSKKQELISEAFNKAYEKLLSLSGEELADTLASLALRAAGGKEGEIILSEKIRAELGDKILSKVSKNKNLRLSDEVRDIDGGLILKNGNTEVNCTFSALVAEKREQMSREIADILFS